MTPKTSILLLLPLLHLLNLLLPISTFFLQRRIPNVHHDPQCRPLRHATPQRIALDLHQRNGIIIIVVDIVSIIAIIGTATAARVLAGNVRDQRYVGADLAVLLAADEYGGVT